VAIAETGAEALSLLHKDRPDLVILDLDFPPDVGNICGTMRDGFMILDRARRMCNVDRLPGIIVSSLEPEKYKDGAKARGLPTFSQKPVSKETLFEAVRGTLEKTGLNRNASCRAGSRH
jgi:CheY-like chemotaxis protein